VILTEWQVRTSTYGSYVPTRMQVPAGLIQAIVTWLREQNAISGTATNCMLDCHGGVHVHGDELRLHRGRWTTAKLQKIATLVGYTGPR